MRTMFGFDILSGRHWHYIAELQAAGTHIKSSFYISLGVIIILTVVVLYILMAPHMQRLKLLRRIHRNNVQTKMTRPKSAPTTIAPQITTEQKIQPTQTTHGPTRPRSPISSMMSHTTQNTASSIPNATMPTPAITPAPISATAPAPAANTTTGNDTFDAIREIFTNAGYVVKRSPRIGNFRPALFAIGTDEELWIGGVGTPQETIADAATRMSSIFSDTLDGIEIQINVFILTPRAPVDMPDILTFNTIDELREFMDKNQNVPPPADGVENFDAYSEYIDTVIKYMDKT